PAPARSGKPRSRNSNQPHSTCPCSSFAECRIRSATTTGDISALFRQNRRGILAELTMTPEQRDQLVQVIEQALAEASGTAADKVYEFFERAEPWVRNAADLLGQ